MGQQQSVPPPPPPPAPRQTDASSQQQPNCQPCFPIFDSIHRQIRKLQAPNSANNNNNSNNINNNYRQSSITTFGTPVPDTPIYTRRKRDETAAGLLLTPEQTFLKHPHSSHQNNNKNTNGSYSYAGLEREATNDEKAPSSSSSSSPSPLVYDGPDAEQVLHSKYQLMEVLGVGSTSTVHRCAHKQHTQQHYACKIIDVQLIEERFQGMMAQFQTEIQALQELRHDGIIRLYDVYQTNEKIFIIMELMEGGELFDYVVQKGTLTEEEASKIVRKVTSAIAYMHQQNFIHRDLKPENLLLKKMPQSPYEDVDVKIIDFGLSKEMEQPITGTFLGTRGYLSPEQLSRRDYTKAVDSWALGVIVFVLLCGCLPFDDDSSAITNEDLVRVKFTLRYPRWAKNLSPSAKDLLSHLLDTNPATRYTADQAKDHPWVRGVTANKDKLLASPGRIKKSPMLMGSGRVGGRFTPGGGRRKDVHTPPTPQGPMVRKTSF